MSVTIGCVDCEATVELPSVPDRPGFVSIEPMTDWTAPPVRCPACSSKEVDRDGDHDR